LEHLEGNDRIARRRFLDTGVFVRLGKGGRLRLKANLGTLGFTEP